MGSSIAWFSTQMHRTASSARVSRLFFMTMVLPAILWKTRSIRLQMFRGTAVLKIIEDFQKIIGGGIRFQ